MTIKLSEYEALVLNNARKYAVCFALRDPWLSFRYQLHDAKKRGIDFNLTFSQWWGLWREKYHLRGTRKGEYVMCRTLDEGPYQIGNVRIDFSSANGHEKKSSNRAKHGCRFAKTRNKIKIAF